MGEGIFGESGKPLIAVFGVAPVLLVLGKDDGGSLAECRDTRLLEPLRDGVEADLDLGAHLGGAFARQGQRNFLRAAQPEVAPLAVFLHPADP